MQDLDPDLQAAWQDAGWSCHSDYVDQEAATDQFKDADALLAELAEQIEEAKAFGDDISDIWLEAGWTLPGSCVGVPWYDSEDPREGIPWFDSEAPDELDFVSSEMTRQVSQAYQFDPPEMLRQVSLGGGMLRQVTSEGDKYVETGDGSTMLRQVSSAMQRQLSDGVAMKRQSSTFSCDQGGGMLRQVTSEGGKYVKTGEGSSMLRQVSSAMQRQLSDGVAMKRQVSTSSCDSLASDRWCGDGPTRHLALEMKQQVSDGAAVLRHDSACSSEGHATDSRRRTVSSSGGYSASAAHTSLEVKRPCFGSDAAMKRQVSTASVESCAVAGLKKSLPVQGVVAIAVAEGATAPRVALQGEVAACATIDHALTTVLDTLAGKCSVEREMTCFHSVRLPRISLFTYLARMRQYLRISDEILILSLVYINRLTVMHPQIELSQLICHRLLLTSVLVSVKFHDDLFPSNKYAACVFGIAAGELNSIEAEFARLLDWQFYVSRSEYTWFLEHLSAMCVEL